MLCAYFAPTSVRAEPSPGEREAARELGSQGTKAFAAGDYAAAAERLERAYAILPAPSLGVWRARALVKLGRLLAASEQYLAVTRLEVKSGNLALQKQAQVDAERERAALLPRIPGIVIQLEGASPAEVTLSMDGAAVSAGMVGERLPVDPGRHSAEAVRNAERVHVALEVAEGEQKFAKLAFTPAPPVVATPPAPAAGAEGGVADVPRPMPTATSSRNQPLPAAVARPNTLGRTLGWVAVGAGGVGIAIGAATGIAVLGKKGALQDNAACRGLRCLPSMNDEVSAYNSLRTVSTASFVVGGVLVGSGLALLLFTPSSGSTDAPSVAVHLSPNGLAARGTF